MENDLYFKILYLNVSARSPSNTNSSVKINVKLSIARKPAEFTGKKNCEANNDFLNWTVLGVT